MVTSYLSRCNFAIAVSKVVGLYCNTDFLLINQFAIMTHYQLPVVGVEATLSFRLAIEVAICKVYLSS